MSDLEQQPPGVTLPLFTQVIIDLIGAPMDDLAAIGTLVSFRAEGFSMYPAIRDGELVTAGPVNADEAACGDVLLCRHSTRVLAHRLVAVNGYGSDRVLHLRGDSNGACDAPVAPADVIGKVLSVWRNGRCVPLCGRAARLRHTALVALSRAKGFVASAIDSRRSRAQRASGRMT
jgi:signal peptidase I